MRLRRDFYRVRNYVLLSMSLIHVNKSVDLWNLRKDLKQLELLDNLRLEAIYKLSSLS